MNDVTNLSNCLAKNAIAEERTTTFSRLMFTKINAHAWKGLSLALNTQKDRKYGGEEIRRRILICKQNFFLYRKDRCGMAFDCKVQYLDDTDPFNSTSFPEPSRPPTYVFRENLPICSQLPAIHRLLNAPHNVSLLFFFIILVSVIFLHFLKRF